MSSFKNKQRRHSSKVLTHFSVSPVLDGVRMFSKEEEMLNAWSREVCNNAKLHIKCDLTMKQRVELFCPSPYAENKMFINESLAFANVGQFAERLNYKIYKNAYRRYNKKLDILAAVEGGTYELRDKPKRDKGYKRFHAHLLIQLPDHLYMRFDGKGSVFCEEMFMDIIREEWNATMFGYDEHKIEPIENKFRAVKYCGKDNLDSISMEHTHTA